MSLIIVGLGIKFFAHLTKESEAVLKQADKVLYLTNDDHYEAFIKDVNPNSESLEPYYFSHEQRSESYRAIKEKILSDLKQVKTLCFAVYGHPTFFVQTTTELYEEAKQLGHQVTVLPAVSSLDCLLTDLSINPGDRGMQIYDATNVLAYRKQLDWSSHVLIYQLGALGSNDHSRSQTMLQRRVKFFSEFLAKQLRCDPPIVIYESSQLPRRSSKIIHTTLSQLHQAQISPLATIYIPPVIQSRRDPQLAALLREADLDTAAEEAGV